jgi:hypothetical protein
MTFGTTHFGCPADRAVLEERQGLPVFPLLVIGAVIPGIFGFELVLEIGSVERVTRPRRACA